MSETMVEVEEKVETEEIQEVDPKIIARAEELGWRPKEEWTGDDKNWIEPERFIERNERLKDRADGIAKAEITRLNGQIAELKSTLEGFKEHYTKAEQTAYNRAIKDLKAQQRKAVEEGDTDAFDRVDAEIADLTKEVETKETAKKTKPEDDPEFRAWQDENSWYGEDIARTVFANQAAEVIGSRPGAPTGRKFFDAVAEAVKAEYPEKFQNPRRKNASTVEGAGEVIQKKGGKSYADLPAEAKAACDNFVKQGLLTREEYVKDFFEEE